MTIGSGQRDSYTLEASVPNLKEIMLATAPWQYCTIFFRVYGFRKIILFILYIYYNDSPLQISWRRFSPNLWKTILFIYLEDTCHVSGRRNYLYKNQENNHLHIEDNPLHIYSIRKTIFLAYLEEKPQNTSEDRKPPLSINMNCHLLNIHEIISSTLFKLKNIPSILCL